MQEGPGWLPGPAVQLQASPAPAASPLTSQQARVQPRAPHLRAQQAADLALAKVPARLPTLTTSPPPGRPAMAGADRRVRCKGVEGQHVLPIVRVACSSGACRKGKHPLSKNAQHAQHVQLVQQWRKIAAAAAPTRQDVLVPFSAACIVDQQIDAAEALQHDGCQLVNGARIGKAAGLDLTGSGARSQAAFCHLPQAGAAAVVARVPERC
jgi:hypothetical protein